MSVKIGTCSWKFSSWAGLVYSAPEPSDYLAEYARMYRTVEIDQWFWSLFGPDTIRLPDMPTASQYASSVDADFRFTIKAANSITLTHIYKKAKRHAGEPNSRFLDHQLLTEFLGRLEPLRPQTDAVMFQFEYLNRAKMSDFATLLNRLRAFFETLPDGWLFAIELRNPNYLKRPYFELLREYGVVHVFSQGYYMPSVLELYEYYRDLLVPQSVIRLMGPDRAGIEELTDKRWDRRLAPKDEELRGISGMIRDMLDRDMDVTVNVNNHYEGSAPRTISALIERLQTEGVDTQGLTGAVDGM